MTHRVGRAAWVRGRSCRKQSVKEADATEENPSCLTTVSLCWDDKGSGKKDWMQTGVHLSLHTNSNMCTCTA